MRSASSIVMKLASASYLSGAFDPKPFYGVEVLLYIEIVGSHEMLSDTCYRFWLFFTLRKHSLCKLPRNTILCSTIIAAEQILKLFFFWMYEFKALVNASFLSQNTVYLPNVFCRQRCDKFTARH